MNSSTYNEEGILQPMVKKRSIPFDFYPEDNLSAHKKDSFLSLKCDQYVRNTNQLTSPYKNNRYGSSRENSNYKNQKLVLKKNKSKAKEGNKNKKSNIASLKPKLNLNNEVLSILKYTEEAEGQAYNKDYINENVDQIGEEEKQLKNVFNSPPHNNSINNKNNLSSGKNSNLYYKQDKYGKSKQIPQAKSVNINYNPNFNSINNLHTTSNNNMVHQKNNLNTIQSAMNNYEYQELVNPSYRLQGNIAHTVENNHQASLQTLDPSIISPLNLGESTIPTAKNKAKLPGIGNSNSINFNRNFDFKGKKEGYAQKELDTEEDGVENVKKNRVIVISKNNLPAVLNKRNSKKKSFLTSKHAQKIKDEAFEGNYNPVNQSNSRTVIANKGEKTNMGSGSKLTEKVKSSNAVITASNRLANLNEESKNSLFLTENSHEGKEGTQEVYSEKKEPREETDIRNKPNNKKSLKGAIKISSNSGSFNPLVLSNLQSNNLNTEEASEKTLKQSTNSQNQPAKLQSKSITKTPSQAEKLNKFSSDLEKQVQSLRTKNFSKQKQLELILNKNYLFAAQNASILNTDIESNPSLNRQKKNFVSPQSEDLNKELKNLNDLFKDHYNKNTFVYTQKGYIDDLGIHKSTNVNRYNRVYQRIQNERLDLYERDDRNSSEDNSQRDDLYHVGYNEGIEEMNAVKEEVRLMRKNIQQTKYIKVLHPVEKKETTDKEKEKEKGKDKKASVGQSKGKSLGKDNYNNTRDQVKEKKEKKGCAKVKSLLNKLIV
eukprot:CAMPEP_0170536772 /NCGR_PEP_ID=MMETSP0209-20121228/102335_1 /TAXON_ID=665100 ORGANISM="Litonotus pictus, Strain P1" /NCGR_SAMPLE_ID=MMETSP0209 /ASSEMBLY_ACC=CAM_ASM_000301 /LENGTH=769 /DNA_ID=CAMNT_0010838173 /DNA_START=548 /DNA_END=2854 /DNA_ORIENTATION=+